MSENLNEKLKMVAEYDGCQTKVIYSVYHKAEVVQDNFQCGVFYNSEYHSNYNRQIPVWQKVCKDFLQIQKDTDDLKEFMLIKERYCKNICYGDVYNCFELLVQAIQFLKQIKNK